MISYEDIEKVQAKCTTKEQAKAGGKGRAGRKQKSTRQEADTQEPEGDTLGPVAGMAKRA